MFTRKQNFVGSGFGKETEGRKQQHDALATDKMNTSSWAHLSPLGATQLPQEATLPLLPGNPSKITAQKDTTGGTTMDVRIGLGRK